MHLYSATAEQFIGESTNGQVNEKLSSAFLKHNGIRPSPSELQSWQNSHRALSTVLDSAGLRKSHVFLEFGMPLCSRRCDVLLTGRSKTGDPNTVVIELKQWNRVEPTDAPDSVLVGGVSMLHPALQVKGYCEYLFNYLDVFTQFGCGITGCAFLHNMSDATSIQILQVALQQNKPLEEYPVFTMSSTDSFARWLRQNLGNGDDGLVPDMLTKSRLRPATKLLDVAAQAIQGNFQWRLLDEQIIVFNTIVHTVERSKTADTKSVIVVRGGPGTGKSILAIQLLAYAASKHWRVSHATGSKAFKTVLQALTQSFAKEVLKQTFGTNVLRDLPVKELFTGFADIGKLGYLHENEFDLVVGDEAHRLWDYRRNKFGGINRQLSTTPMLDEIIRASQVTALFLDDNQTVRADEIGSSAYITNRARALGAQVKTIDLDIQFRCAGSKAYTDWIDHIFDFSKTSLPPLNFQEYDFRIVQSMPQMQEIMDSFNKSNHKCRFLAGFCWNWHPDNAGVHPDIQDRRFHGWSKPWIENTNQENSRNVLTHSYYRWATDDTYYGQVGSIYSVQGFEFDYIGLIVGEDLVRRGDRWVADLSNNKDKQFKRDIKKADPVEKLKNIYRVLLTRGMKGTFVFFLDAETQKFFERQLRTARERNGT